MTLHNNPISSDVRTQEIEVPVSVTGWCDIGEIPDLLKLLTETAIREVLTDVHQHLCRNRGLYFSAMVYANTKERRSKFDIFQEITWGRELADDAASKAR